MTAFNPKAIVPASKSAEFNAGAMRQRDPKAVLAASIDHQIALFKEPKVEGKRWFTAGKTEIAFTIRYANKALVLVDGESKVVVPTDQFEAALAYYKDQATKGVFDPQLVGLAKSVEARGAKMRATRAAKRDNKS